MQVSDLISGDLGPHLSTGVELSAEECLYLATSRFIPNPPLVQHSLEEKIPEFALTIEWLEAGHKLAHRYFVIFHKK